MANGYTFEREGDGYRFFPEELDPAGLGNRPFFTGNGPVLISALVLVIGFATHSAFALLAALGLAGWLLYGRYLRPPPAALVAQGQGLIRAAGVLVTPAAIVTAGSETIPISRVNSIDISNEFDDYIAGHAGSRTQYQAGSGLAAAEAIGHGRRMNTAKTRYIVTVQHGPTATILMKRLSASGANGLQADIRRVLQGQSLD